jgi:hypothetical protein
LRVTLILDRIEPKPSARDVPLWWQRAEQLREEKEQRPRRRAMQRLRRFEEAARARLAREPASLEPRPLVLDSDRLAAPFLDRIGVRGRIQLLLWSGMTIVGVFSLVSFFSAPLMDFDLAISALLVLTMLVLAYAM